MADLTTQLVDEDGLNPSYDAAAAGGDTFANDTAGRTFIHVKNDDASSHTVTVSAVQSSVRSAAFGPLVKEDISVAIPAGEDRMIGPIKTAAFGKNPSITYDDVTSVTIAVIKV